MIVCMRFRKPRMQLHVHEVYSGGGAGEDEAGGAVHEAVISALLENGRLRLEQVQAASHSITSSCILLKIVNK